ncbi:MAG TPA: V-type ATP synthase subunit I, partial [Clostridiales bacterium]|nr:V-type ATP synthase subunit I [Clostridiales bacterium]
AVLFAGRKEKFFGKLTKGFSAVYGVINFLSDILSYARLYGMMLSGVILGGLVSGYSVDFIKYFSASGNFVWIIGAVLLFLIGHAFNLAMGLLGAYIHDSRLQYVEFFSRFFEGEGELFKPLGYNRIYSVQIK